MDKLTRFLNTLKLFGFAILDSKNTEIVDVLKDSGLLQLFRVRRLNGYTILEIDSDTCEKECDFNCRDGNGKRIKKCYGECIDRCVIDELNSIIKSISKMLQ
ncbi:MAG: hypothetical protein QXW05_04080 [Ignisphaera sp.]|uniref:Uncharacterized protein n=1 Tax=Ignisphaera aggregans TaxID=334771 RepID=A0A7C4H297_9CREN